MHPEARFAYQILFRVDVFSRVDLIITQKHKVLWSDFLWMQYSVERKKMLTAVFYPCGGVEQLQYNAVVKLPTDNMMLGVNDKLFVCSSVCL